VCSAGKRNENAWFRRNQGAETELHTRAQARARASPMDRACVRARRDRGGRGYSEVEGAG